MVSKIIIEGPIVKMVTRSGNGGHVIVPEDWIGKTVRVTPIDNVSEVDQANTKEGKKEIHTFSKSLHTKVEKIESKKPR